MFQSAFAYEIKNLHVTNIHILKHDSSLNGDLCAYFVRGVVKNLKNVGSLKSKGKATLLALR